LSDLRITWQEAIEQKKTPEIPKKQDSSHKSFSIAM
jgi:hypothetical protein